MEEKRRKLFIYLPIIFALIFIAGMFLGARIISGSSSIGLSGSIFPVGAAKYDKFNDVINYIQNSYVDTVSRKQLTDEAISSLLEKLDPHSAYISAAEFNDANDPLIGSFEGIGVEFRVQRDSVTVMNVIPKGPSESIGLMAGDRIVKVDGKNIAGIKISNNDVIKKLKGKRGTKVTISVFRRGINKLIPYTITRDVIPTYSLDIAYMLTNKIGYIRLNKFSATTFQEFDDALKKLKTQGMTKLVLDLRDNGGGYLQAAIDIADEFLSEGKLIVYTKGIHKPKSVEYATNKGNFEKGQLVILVNEFTASASEIVSGAIQDNDRGIIIGRKSFGKGLVQEQVKLSDGSAIRLTIARYYTPTGRCIQRPYSEGTEEYYNQFYEQLIAAESENPDSIKFADSLKFKTPKGKIVYGGGGIMPDVYITVDKDEKSKYFNLLFNKGFIFQFAFDYVDKNRQNLKRLYKSSQEFINGFTVNDAILNDLISYSTKNGLKKDENGIKLSGDKIKIYLKANIGRNIFRDDAYYPVIQKVDNTLIKAISVIDTLK